MTVSAWRIAKRKHARKAFMGEGARLYGGRWNSPGIGVVYTAESQALAALELLVHLDSPELLGAFVFMEAQIDESLIAVQETAALPKGWRDLPAPPELRAIGDGWVKEGRSVVLRVPSAIVPSENNYLLNPAHHDFTKIKLGKPLSFRFDMRILKGSSH